MATLDGAGWRTDQWQSWCAVSVADSGGAPIAGTYRVAHAAVEFVPAYPLDPGRSYAVRIDPSRLPSGRDEAVTTTTLALPPAEMGPATVVTGIHPATEVWPANLLRFYVHFSDAMPRGTGSELVRVVDEHGRPVDDALLRSPVDFWSPDQRRTTVFFDPGRVKRDLIPNRALGRALQQGRRYTIVIDRAWKDAYGRELGSEFRKTITVGAPVERPLRLADWRLTSPRAGSRDSLTVKVPWPLDHALFARALRVTSGGEIVDGRADVRSGDTEWQFVPASPWDAGLHRIEILGVLEDPSGNMIDQAFEVDSRRAGDGDRPDRYFVPFTPTP